MSAMETNDKATTADSDLLSGMTEMPHALGPYDTEEEFKQQYRALFKSDAAQRVSRLVYVWVLERAVPRANGESRIMYIGKTNSSLAVRKGSELRRELPNFHWYSKYFKSFGAMRVFVRECLDPKTEESSLLAKYHDVHWEEPPLNRTCK